MPMRNRFLEPMIAVALGIYFLVSALPPAWKTLNTDFPNYYLTARLIREHTDTARAYEWLWVEREKDHRGLDQRIVGLVPITPFSTLMVWPLASYPALTAKHIWIALNLGLLIGILFLLSRVSGLSPARVGILMALSYPLQFNFMLGQYYVLLLALLTGACWAAQLRRRALCGFLVGTAAAIKIFPLILILYFLRKRDWRALVACALAIFASLCISIRVFGMEMHRTYLRQVLPWTLRGEGLPPFHLGSSSLSTVLHRLFLYEPQWNPQPAIDAPWLFPVLHATIQFLLLAPAILLIRRTNSSPQRTALEWSGLLLVSLTISTSPGSYLFTILILPVAVICKSFIGSRRLGLALLTIGAFLAIGWPDWHISDRAAWGTLLCVPRLYALLAITLIAFFLLVRKMSWRLSANDVVWAVALFSATLLSVTTGVMHQRRLFDDYQYRLPMPANTFLAAHPESLGAKNIAYIGLTMDGYRAEAVHPPAYGEIERPNDALADQLSIAVRSGQVWAEDVMASSSVRPAGSSFGAIVNAESPTFSFDGKTAGYLRLVNGHREQFVRDLGANEPERQLTYPPFDIYESAFLIDNDLVVAASRGDTGPTLYRLSLSGVMTPLVHEESRYPAASPDGHWLAFSQFAEGNWNLRLLDMRTARATRISQVPCNQLEPSWEPDSKTLLYASDCGRALWFTALARRSVIP